MGKIKAALKSNWEFLTDFDRKQPFFKKMMIVITLLVVQLAYVALIVNLLKHFFGEQIFHKWGFSGIVSNNDIYTKLQTSLSQGSLGVNIFFACILAPLWEEFVFRAYGFWEKLRERDKEELKETVVIEKLGRIPIWTLAIMSSIIFGIIHGGPINILIQGAGGLFLSYAFLKNGRSYWSAVALHAAYNGSLILFFFIGAKNAIAGLTLPFWLLWF